MALISNATTIFDNGSMSAGFGGSMTFIKKLTASSSATLSFVDGTDGVVLDGTYKEYVFTFNNIHPSGADTFFSVNFRDGDTAYDAVKTTTSFYAQHGEADDETQLSYYADGDLAQSTAAQKLNSPTGNQDADKSLSGYLHLFNPSSTTFVKHFMSTTNDIDMSNYCLTVRVAGYCNTTTAIDGVQFTFSSGNIDDGDICLYGIA